jgi:hypothetical protein
MLGKSKIEVLSENSKTGDFIKIGSLMMFSVTNGYCQTVCACLAPVKVGDSDRMEDVG